MNILSLSNLKINIIIKLLLVLLILTLVSNGLMPMNLKFTLLKKMLFPEKSNIPSSVEEPELTLLLVPYSKMETKLSKLSQVFQIKINRLFMFLPISYMPEKKHLLKLLALMLMIIKLPLMIKLLHKLNSK